MCSREWDIHAIDSTDECEYSCDDRENGQHIDDGICLDGHQRIIGFSQRIYIFKTDIYSVFDLV